MADGPRVGVRLFRSCSATRRARASLLSPLRAALMELDQQVKASVCSTMPSRSARRSCLRRVAGQASTGSSLGRSALWRVWRSTAQLRAIRCHGGWQIEDDEGLGGGLEKVVMASGLGRGQCPAPREAWSRPEAETHALGVRRPAASCVPIGKARSQAASVAKDGVCYRSVNEVMALAKSTSASNPGDGRDGIFISYWQDAEAVKRWAEQQTPPPRPEACRNGMMRSAP